MSEVRLPRAIRAEQQQAEAIQAQMNGPTQAENLVPVEELAEPAPTPAPAAPTPAPAVAQTTAPQSDDWEQKYRTLQGMFRAELNRQVEGHLQQSRQRESELLTAVQQLQQDIRQIREKPAAAAAAPDPKDVEAFGAELVEMVNRNAASQIAGAVQQALAEVSARLERLEQQHQVTAKTAAMSAEQAFYADLTARVPDWKAVNVDPGFLTWLGQPDALTGDERQLALDRASASLNAERAAAVFLAYKATVTPAAQPVARASEVESQVAPSRSGASAAPADTTPRLVSQQEVVKFYDDVRRGVYRGREQEQQQIEAAINKAIAEGRIR